MTSGQRVLVIDGLSETEEVLKAVLEPRGLKVERVCGGRSRDHFHGYSQPSVVVVHLDEADSHKIVSEGWNTVPRVVIGSTKQRDCTSDGQGHCFLQNPFQYRELIQAIEHLLAD